MGCELFRVLLSTCRRFVDFFACFCCRLVNATYKHHILGVPCYCLLLLLDHQWIPGLCDPTQPLSPCVLSVQIGTPFFYCHEERSAHSLLLLLYDTIDCSIRDV